MDSATAYLMASLTGENAPAQVSTDASSYSPGNITSAGAMTKSWPLLAGTPVAGTVYSLTTEFSGTWEANALAFAVGINNGSSTTWTQMNPAVGSSAWAASTVIAGWLSLTVRVLTSTTARVALAGTVSETTTSITPSTGSCGLAPLSQTLTVGAGYTVALGYLFGASNAAQGLATYGSTFTQVS